MLCTSGTALAQQSNSNNDNDIVVTASKREQNLQDVPLAITAIGTERLDELQVKEFQDVVKFLPSVTIQTAGPAQSWNRRTVSIPFWMIISCAPQTTSGTPWSARRLS